MDAQSALPHARGVVDYAAPLGKPIIRLYITHEHPDHYLGAEVFGAPVYALAEVKRVTDAQGDAAAAQFHAQFGDIFPTHAKSAGFPRRAGKVAAVRFGHTQARAGLALPIANNLTSAAPAMNPPM